MRQFRVYPYKMGSKSATMLSEGLRGAGERCFKIYPNRRYIPRDNHTIINWGFSREPEWVDHGVKWLNQPEFVKLASNKLTAFEIMKEVGISIPEFTINHAEANNWEAVFFGRKKLTGHSGEGILVFDPEYPHEEGGLYPAPSRDNPHAQDSCPLYVKYIKKSEEYRVHVFQGKVIDVQMKRKKRNVNNEDIDYQIRNHKNGWVYCREDIHPDESVLSESIRAVDCLGLDFGAVDVIWNHYYQKSYVLEVNCAPGLEGETLNKYVNVLKGEL